MSASPFTVGISQHAPVFLNRDATVDKALALIDEASALGVDVLVFSETWLGGYPLWIDSAPGAAIWDQPGARALFRVLRANAFEVGGASCSRLRAAADRLGMVVVIGVHEVRGATLYNTVVTYDGEGGRTLHRKLVPTYTERLLWGAGDGSTLAAASTRHGVIGSLVCWEHWMPLARAAMHAQTEVLHIAQWPWVRELHQVCSRQYAFEGQCFVAASGCTMTRGQMLEGFESVAALAGDGEQAARDLLVSIPGDDDTLLLEGGSTLIGPDIGFVAAPVFGGEGFVIGVCDPGRIEEGRMYMDTDGHYSRPDVFRLDIDTRPRANVHGLGARSE